MSNRKLISIVIPVYNEQEVLPELLKQLALFFQKNKRYAYEAILVEHGSSDRSFKILKKASQEERRFKILQLSKNFGCDGGITAGLKYAKGDAAVIMMADLQEPIDLISDFIKYWEKGYDIVYGVVKKRTSSKLRNLNSIFYYKLLNKLTNNEFPENASDFRLIDKAVYQAINNMKEQNKYLRGLIMWTGFKHIGIPFDRQSRFAGESKADLKTALYVALNGIFSFSYVPLRFVSIIGIALTFFSFILGVFYFWLYFTYGRQAPGAATIIILTLFLFGILFFILGIISEYLARIYDEVKGRPNFIVKKTVNL